MPKVAVPTVALFGQRRAGDRYVATAWLRRRFGGIQQLFLVGVVLPTILATIYYGLIASSRFVTEAQFVVRGMSQHKTSGLDMVFQSLGLSPAIDDANVIQAYVESRDAMHALNSKLPLREYFGRSRADVLSRFPRPWTSGSDEQLYAYYADHVSILHSASKGITTLKVEAFDADEAQEVARQLLALAEGMVNQMNERAQSDAVRYADADLDAAKAKLVKAQEALTRFRTTELLIDPSSSSMSLLDTITALSTDLARANTEVDQASASMAASPRLPTLVEKVTVLKNRITEERARMAGDSSALAPRVAAYEGLVLARELAEKSVVQANLSLDAARQEARRQQIYIERIVSPQRPDEAMQPQRPRMILTVFVLCFAMTSVVWLLRAGVSEHAVA